MGLLDKRAAKWMERSSKSGKQTIKYKMHCYEDRSFMVEFDLEVEEKWITSLSQWFIKRKTGKEAMTMDSFDVPESLFGKVLKRFKQHLIEVENATGKKMPGFRIVAMKIEKFRFNKGTNGMFSVQIEIIGDYTTV